MRRFVNVTVEDRTSNEGEMVPGRITKDLSEPRDVTGGLPFEMLKMYADLERIGNDREEREAKADPHGWRKSRLFPKGASYRYYKAGPGLRYCYSVHRNAAGYFLAWRERTMKGGRFTRDQYVPSKIKREVIEHARKAEAKSRGAE